MKKVVVLSILLVFGLILSQYLSLIPEPHYSTALFIIKNITMVCLGFIMIHVGLEFSVDRTRVMDYAWDYVVAFTAATFPWIFCTLYFVYAYEHDPKYSAFEVWTDSLLLGRFASPTSAGILFTMLAAAGLAASWVFKKTRILAIFDDLDTILLLIPIRFLIIGFRWELIAFILVPIVAMLYYGWKRLHSVILPLNWYYLLIYSTIITVILESVYHITHAIDGVIPLSMEILLPAFVLGCVLTCKGGEEKIHTFLQLKKEKMARWIISIIFISLVGISMPPIEQLAKSVSALESGQVSDSIFDIKIGSLTLGRVIIDVLIITLLSNLGKMFPIFCYRREAKVWQRVALSLGMCLRGEVGAGIIIISIGLLSSIDKSLVIVAILSLALNFILTPPFIMIIRKLHTRYGSTTA